MFSNRIKVNIRKCLSIKLILALTDESIIVTVQWHFNQC